MKKLILLSLILIALCNPESVAGNVSSAADRSHAKDSASFARSAEDVLAGRRSVADAMLGRPVSDAFNMELVMRSALKADLAPSAGDAVSFRNDHLMVAMSGNVNGNLSYSFRQRLNRQAAFRSLENLWTATDVAYLKYSFLGKYSLVAGRQLLLMGGFEYDEHPVNIYGFSGINDNVTCYLTGLTFFWNPVEGQEFGFQVMNNRQGSMEDAFGTLPAGIRRPYAPLLYSLAWNSSYLEGKIKLRYAVSAAELAAGRWMLLAGGGQRFRFGMFDAYLDVLYQRSPLDQMGMIRSIAFKPDGTPWTDAVECTDYLSVAAEVNLRVHPKWNVRIKGFHDRGWIYEDNAIFGKGLYMSAWGTQGTVEFYPMSDDNLHVYLNFCGKMYDDTGADCISATDTYMLSLGFIYRLPLI